MKKSKFRKIVAIILCISMIFSMNSWAFADEGVVVSTETEAAADVAVVADEGEGTATEGEGTATEGEGTATEGEGTATEGEGTATEGEGTATEGEGTATEDEVTATEDEVTATGDGTPADDENVGGGSAVLAEDDAFTLCPECGMAGIHLVSCPEYTCPECGQAESHSADCPQNTPAEPEISVAEALLGAASVEEMYIGVLELMNTAPDTLMALTAEEIAALRARISELDPEGDDADTIDLLDTLAFLPNGAETCTIEGCQNHNSTPQTCEECGQTEGHAETCSLYVAPGCTECGLTEGHLETCVTLAVCNICGETGKHFTENCAFYGPVTADVYNETNDGYAKIDGHGESAPIDVEKFDGKMIYVQKSDTAQNIYFEHGTFWGIGVTYSIDEETYACLNDTDDNTWLGSGKALVTLAAGTPADTEIILTADMGMFGKQSVTIKVIEGLPEVPDIPVIEVPECDCGYTGDGGLDTHADSCGRKQYVKSLFENKTAEEIHAEWDGYDEATQTDLLNMLKVWDNAKYEELKELIAETDVSCGFDIVYVEYTGTAANGIGAKILAPEGSFPDGATVSVTDADVSASEVDAVVKNDILEIVSVDISFDGTEPLNEVMVSLDIPAEKVPAAANKVIIVHMSSSGPEIVGTKYLNTADLGETIAFKTNSFSSYAAVFVNGKYNAQKMSEILRNNNRYEISTFNVDLFDYDPVKMNNVLNVATSDGNGFHLTGYGIEGMGTNNGINNSASTYAKQGILHNRLQDGLPLINFLNGDNAGAETGEILFSDSYTFDGKTLYNDIPFEFIYDSNTGYYEYKSSANHAQLNDDKNRIELYADTLSTENNYVATLDLSTATGINDYVSVTTYSNSFKATAKNGSTAATDRLDPYVTFTVENVSAADVGQIYVKAKVPASVGKNKFQVFFNVPNETNSYMQEYTANGDWIEFVIDTNDINNWNGTITQLRIDLFDKNQGESVIDTATYDIEIAQISLIRENYDAYATRGGFYPFSEIQDSYPGNNTGFNYDAWESLFLNDELSMARASRSIFNPTPSSEALRYEELAYGMVMEFDFYMPVNREGKDLTYYFNGDDDLWVFVDNQLVLDIGGGHGAITGTVDFSQGTTSVENAVTVTGYNSGADATAAQTDGTLEETLLNPGKHTMKIFYLERGGSVSNCFMKFNLPQTPEAAVTVSKEVKMTDGSKTDLADKPFKFQITTEYEGTQVDGVTYLDGKKLEYTLIGDNLVDDQNDPVSSLTRNTDENGYFYLLDGQYAMFDVPENYNVTIVEITDSDGYENVFDEYGNIYVGKKKFEYDETQSGVLINDEKPETDDDYTNLTVENGSLIYAFTNVYKELNKADLTIIKNVDTTNLDQNFYFQLRDIDTNAVWDVVIHASDIIAGEDSITIADLPVGQYEVTEKTDWSWRYEFRNVTAMQDKDASTDNSSITFDFTYVGETVTFTNERDVDKWLDGEAWCKNIFDEKSISSEGDSHERRDNPEPAAILAVKRDETEQTAEQTENSLGEGADNDEYDETV